MSVQPAGLYPWLRPTYAKLANLDGNDHHAVLLAAPKGIGHGQLVSRLIELKHCSCPNNSASGQKACGGCQNCLLHAAGSHPDHIVIKPLEGKAQISIEQVRACSAKVLNKGLISPYRVVEIDQAHLMTVSAANALLKMLEEPPTNVYFILSTDQPSQLPATVLSRCVKTTLERPNPTQSLNWINRQLDKPISLLDLYLVDCAPLSALQMGKAGGFEQLHEVLNGYCLVLGAVNAVNFNAQCISFIEQLRLLEKSVSHDEMLNLMLWLNNLSLKKHFVPQSIVNEVLAPEQAKLLTQTSPRYVLACNSGIVELRQQLIQNNGINVLLQLQQVIVNCNQPLN